MPNPNNPSVVKTGEKTVRRLPSRLMPSQKALGQSLEQYRARTSVGDGPPIILKPRRF